MVPGQPPGPQCVHIGSDQDLGCVDAINLDGGGSTTLWLKGKGIVNFPSDETGERPVANVFLIMEK